MRRAPGWHAATALALALAASASAQQPEPIGQAVPQSFTIEATDPVLQVLPGPATFADRVLAMADDVPPERRQRLRQIALEGPFSNRTREVEGTFRAVFVDRGAAGDSAEGAVQLWLAGNEEWRIVIDDVRPEGDPPRAPHWGGVAAYVPLHGTSGHHNPFVPTVNAIAFWGTADVYLGSERIRADAPIHVMLTSKTRGEDGSYQCYECRGNPMTELHLIMMPGPDAEPYPAPGGFLHFVWPSASLDVDLVP